MFTPDKAANHSCAGSVSVSVRWHLERDKHSTKQQNGSTEQGASSKAVCDSQCFRADFSSKLLNWKWRHFTFSITAIQASCVFFTSPQGVGIHCSLSFLGQRRRTQVSWALGLWCCLHMLSGTTTALAPGSVLRQNTLRFLSPRPQVLEHCEWTGRK